MATVIYHDQGSSASTRAVQVVHNPDNKGFGPKITCTTGRVLGTQDSFARAEVGGILSNLSAEGLRALAEMALVAAEVLEGKREAESITRYREQWNKEFGVK